MNVTPEVKGALMRFMQREIKAGEAVLLARLIADRIPVDMSAEEPWQQTLKYRSSVNGVLFSLNEFIHIPTNTMSHIYLMIERIWMWRRCVASGDSNVIFSGDQCSVIDDFSGLMRHLNLSDISPVADMVMSANEMYQLFKKVVDATWNQGGAA